MLNIIKNKLITRLKKAKWRNNELKILLNKILKKKFEKNKKNIKKKGWNFLLFTSQKNLIKKNISFTNITLKIILKSIMKYSIYKNEERPNKERAKSKNQKKKQLKKKPIKKARQIALKITSIIVKSELTIKKAYNKNS